MNILTCIENWVTDCFQMFSSVPSNEDSEYILLNMIR
jgi:hypothetical protein